MRASYGMSYLPLGGTGGLVTVRQNGYSRSTPYVLDQRRRRQFLHPQSAGQLHLGQPVPGGSPAAYGNSLGARTFVGQGITYDDPNYEIPRVHQFNVGFEYELPWWKTVLEASYVGSRTHKLSHSQNINAISMAQRLTVLRQDQNSAPTPSPTPLPALRNWPAPACSTPPPANSRR